MNVKKNDEITLKIESLTSEGSGLGRYYGLAVFVRGTVPGDVINAHIIKVYKNYAVAVIKNIVSPSESRIESDCLSSAKCGGCSFRNMTYAEELRYKKSRVTDALERIGGIKSEIFDEIIGAENIYNYRNKAQYPVLISGGNFYAGFYAYKSHRIVPCDDCRIQPAEFGRGLSAFSRWAMKSKVTSYDEKTGEGLLRHIYFRKGFKTGEVMACVVINGDDIPQKELLISLLREQISSLASVSLNINRDMTNVVLGKKTVTLWGSDGIKDILLGKTFFISPASFYQINHDQCEKLYQKAAEYACLTGNETLVDLYCGVGTIGLTMADKVKKLVGIEIVFDAIQNARKNAEINKIGNARFLCADAFDGAVMLKKENIKPDIIILDPPRKGCAPELIETVCKMTPKRVIYVSCDPSTLARDLKMFVSKGYEAQKVSAVDMFPRTPHIESVACINKAKD